MEQQKSLKTLFFSTLYISALTFGGGFVIVTFMKKKFVDELHWISEEEMLDITALAQSSPGAIAVNASILMGWRLGGFVGMIVAVLATIIPPIVIISVISLFYAAFATNRYVALILKGMQAAVSAIIFDVVLTLGSNVIKLKNYIYNAIMVVAFFAVLIFNVNVIYIILGAALIGIVTEFVNKKRRYSK